jgi:hypothetical protein
MTAMTARKASSKKKAGAKNKASSKKTSLKKASSKKTSSKKAPAKKAATKKKAAAKKSVATKKSAAAKKPAAKKATANKATAQAKKAPPAKSGSSSMLVSMGHVFALRPRVVTSFRPDDFRRARQVLAEEAYATIHEAARAVAERALELTHGGRQTAIPGARKPKLF